MKAKLLGVAAASALAAFAAACPAHAQMFGYGAVDYPVVVAPPPVENKLPSRAAAPTASAPNASASSDGSKDPAPSWAPRHGR